MTENQQRILDAIKSLTDVKIDAENWKDYERVYNSLENLRQWWFYFGEGDLKHLI